LKKNRQPKPRLAQFDTFACWFAFLSFVRKRKRQRKRLENLQRNVTEDEKQRLEKFEFIKI
jgi:hypothetical protein